MVDKLLLVSIIVPVYNSEKFLNECIESILKQTMKDFELILVDDGSKDSSGKICDCFAQKDKRIRVIHKKNGGNSSARNAGLDVAQGKYIMFCDSDDFVDEKWCERLLQGIKNYSYHWVMCDVYNVRGNDCCEPQLKNRQDGFLFMDYFDVFKIGLSAYVPNKIYRMDIIRENHIRFDEKRTNAEDIGFNIKYYNYCDGGLVLTDALYYYRQNEASITHTYNKELFEVMLYAFESRLPVIKEHQMLEYCDIWLYYFITVFQNVFDKRNKDIFINKLRYNQKMVCSDGFQYCLRHASGNKENSTIIKWYKKKKYYWVYVYELLWRIKNEYFRKRKNSD